MKSNPSRYKYTRFLGTALFVVAVSLNLSGVTSNSAKAAAVAADWNTPSTGTIGGVSFSISGLSSPFLAINPNGSFSGPNYAFAPLTDVESIDYGSSNDWSATFASPITDLFIYAGSWRGTFTTGADPSTNYTFSRPFTIVSGLAAATVNGNTLTIPDGGVNFHDGILKFSGLITNLSVSSDGLNESGQNMTFVATVPEPTSAVLILCGAAFCLVRRSFRTHERGA